MVWLTQLGVDTAHVTHVLPSSSEAPAVGRHGLTFVPAVQHSTHGSRAARCWCRIGNRQHDAADRWFPGTALLNMIAASATTASCWQMGLNRLPKRRSPVTPQHLGGRSDHGHRLCRDGHDDQCKAQQQRTVGNPRARRITTASNNARPMPFGRAALFVSA